MRAALELVGTAEDGGGQDVLLTNKEEDEARAESTPRAPSDRHTLRQSEGQDAKRREGQTLTPAK